MLELYVSRIASFKKSSRHNGERKGFTLVELLVVIGIIAVLIAMLLPALSKARKSAANIACQSNMRQIYNAVLLYTQDYKGEIPRAVATNKYNPWDFRQTKVARYIQGKQNTGDAYSNIWICPTQLGEFPRYPDTAGIAYRGMYVVQSYWHNNHYWGEATPPSAWMVTHKLSHPIVYNSYSGATKRALPAEAAMMGETATARIKGMTDAAGNILPAASQNPGGYHVNGQAYKVGTAAVFGYNHGKPPVDQASAAAWKMNVLYFDGHVGSMNGNQVYSLVAGIDRRGCWLP